MQKLLLNALAFLLSLLLKWLAKKFVPSDTKKTTKVVQVPKPARKTQPGASVTPKKKLINTPTPPVISMPTQEQITDRDMRLSGLRDRLRAGIEQSKQLGKYEIMNDPAIWKKGHKQEEGVDKDGISKTSAQGSAEEAGS